MNLQTLFKISRPRFWLYLAGPYLIGYVAGISKLSDIYSLQFFFYLLYFLIPANIFLYGINDLADEDTDQFNDKKNSYEHRVQKKQKFRLQLIVVGCVLLTFGMVFFANNLIASVVLLLLLFLSFSYSYPPFRWKAQPFIDSASNILYIVPGIFSYYLTSGSILSIAIIISGGLWSAAMHLFSAIPDISADSEAHLHTTAVILGKSKSLLFCSGLWLLACVLSFWKFPSIWLLPLIMYPLIPFLTYIKKWSVSKVYTYFPILNTIIGSYLFWYIVILKF